MSIRMWKFVRMGRAFGRESAKMINVYLHYVYPELKKIALTGVREI